MAQMTIREGRRRLIEKALADDAFREKLLKDPKACIEEEFGVSVPEQVEVTVLEETPGKVFLVLPAKRKAVLREEDLAKTAAGDSSRWGCSCGQVHCICG